MRACVPRCGVEADPAQRALHMRGAGPLTHAMRLAAGQNRRRDLFYSLTHQRWRHARAQIVIV
jgi:hypothetical protein